jgi:cytosine/adenosine deaminase-related metal-dependent hydrolase
LRRHFARFGLSLADYGPLFEHLRTTHHDKERGQDPTRAAQPPLVLGCALEMLADLSARHQAPMHMHLVETACQKKYARRRGSGTALDYIDRFDFLGPRLTLGHGVWPDEADLDRIAASGTHICHNCSSNFRLRSGVAPLNAFEKRGINTAIGLDEAGINDDRDMLQEMRMVLRTGSRGWWMRTSRAPARYCAWRQQAAPRPPLRQAHRNRPNPIALRR